MSGQTGHDGVGPTSARVRRRTAHRKRTDVHSQDHYRPHRLRRSAGRRSFGVAAGRHRLRGNHPSPEPDHVGPGNDVHRDVHRDVHDAIKGIETVKALGGEPEFRTLMLDQFQGVARRLRW